MSGIHSRKDAVSSMLKSHELLLKFRHDGRFEFTKVRVIYVDRGAPGDRSCVNGDEIPELEAYYFEVKSSIGIKYIPYHRIRQIQYAGVTIWQCPEPATSGPGTG
jgi:hypothetical protein